MSQPPEPSNLLWENLRVPEDFDGCKCNNIPCNKIYAYILIIVFLLLMFFFFMYLKRLVAVF
jgi:hypothetical protein